MRGTLVALVSAGFGLGLAWVAAPTAPRLGGVPLPVLGVLLAFGINWLAWVPAAIGRTERFYDLVGSLTYLSVVAVAAAARAGTLSAANALPAVLVAVWATRLGTFLFQRVRRAGKDRRFDAIKQAPLRFLVAWSLQGLWVSLTLLAVLIQLSRTTAPPLDGLVLLGAGVWGVGFALEVVADRQKTAFRADPANRDRWVDTGLWAWSRHPNYFGEIVLWTGLFLCGAGSYRGAEWLAALSPVFVTILLTRVSGVPLLEAAARERWGQDPAWRAYVANTPVLVPRPPRRG